MSGDKLTWNGTFTMAVGGMVGGGIFSVLGVVIGVAGARAWVSLVLGGVIALLAARSYVALTTQWQVSGGSYGYLRHIGHPGFAGTLAWVLVIGYVLTLAVYAFTFGHYLANVLGLATGVWPRVFAVGIIAALVSVNLRGVGDSQRLEEITVWAKMAVLLGLAAIGLVRFDAANLSSGGVGGRGWLGVVVGAASVFMAYEGFQLLAYDYDDIQEPDRTLPRAVTPAVAIVMVTYVAVALGVASLVGAGVVVDKKEIALAAAGRVALGTAGLVIVTVAAVFSTGSAINATLFATARLARSVAGDGQYPRWLGATNERGAPYGAVLTLGVLAAVLAATGGLSTLVESASLVFLVTFAIVGGVAWRSRVGRRLEAAAGTIAAAAAAVVLAVRITAEQPVALLALLVAVAAAAIVRPLVQRPQDAR